MEERGLDQLLADARRGNRRAFASFIAETSPEVFALCSRVLGPRDAEDALQETYLALWRSLASFRGDSSARTWLFVIARRTTYRLLRKRERWSALASAAPLRASEVPGETLEIEDAISRLPLDQRTAIVLTQLLGFSYEETGVICDCPLGTVRSRVARARAALAAQLSSAAAVAQ